MLWAISYYSDRTNQRLWKHNTPPRCQKDSLIDRMTFDSKNY